MKSLELSTPGTHRDTLRFSHRMLADWEWPVIEIVGEQPGPRIAIWAGMHVNELSSIEAAYRLAEHIRPAAVNGRVSIIPILNLPALASRTKIACPIDGKNINFFFPGSPTGTFSEVLAYSLLNEWADDAVCTFDLHGGDVNEDVAQYIMVQLTGDAGFDAELRATADAWGASNRVEFPPAYLDGSGRSILGRSKQRKLAVMSEAGCNVRLAENDVDFHFRGVLGVATKLGVLKPGDVSAATPATPTFTPSEVHVVRSELRGWGDHLKRPGDPIKRGDVLVNVHDYESGEISPVLSPYDGRVIWTDHHPALEVDQAVGGIAV